MQKTSSCRHFPPSNCATVVPRPRCPCSSLQSLLILLFRQCRSVHFCNCLLHKEILAAMEKDSAQEEPQQTTGNELPTRPRYKISSGANPPLSVLLVLCGRSLARTSPLFARCTENARCGSLRDVLRCSVFGWI